jgi:Domain of unknown function (DUF4375)
MQKTLASLCLSIVISCNGSEKEIDTYGNLKQELRGIELERITPHADPDEFEMEVNNGGLNQYFFNSSGQNCFATLRYFQENGKTKEAKILAKAINLINPKKLPEAELIENLRKRIVTELDDSVVNLKLSELDNEYYK